MNTSPIITSPHHGLKSGEIIVMFNRPYRVRVISLFDFEVTRLGRFERLCLAVDRFIKKFSA